MNFKMLKAAIAGLVLSVSGFANAGLITVVFDVTNYDDEVGNFSGSDLNNDLILSFDELTAFDWTSTHYGHVIDDTTDLHAFGDFNLATNTWNSNGGAANNVYFSWNNGSNTMKGSWADVSIISSDYVSTEVPEPTTLAIFALGIMGLASRRFKKQ